MAVLKVKGPSPLIRTLPSTSPLYPQIGSIFFPFALCINFVVLS